MTNTRSGPLHGLSDESDRDTAVAFRLLIALLGDDLAGYVRPVRPPAHLRQAVRCAPTPVLRGVLADVARELYRRKHTPPEEGAGRPDEGV